MNVNELWLIHALIQGLQLKQALSWQFPWTTSGPVPPTSAGRFVLLSSHWFSWDFQTFEVVVGKQAVVTHPHLAPRVGMLDPLLNVSSSWIWYCLEQFRYHLVNLVFKGCFRKRPWLSNAKALWIAWCLFQWSIFYVLSLQHLVLVKIVLLCVSSTPVKQRWDSMGSSCWMVCARAIPSEQTQRLCWHARGTCPVYVWFKNCLQSYIYIYYIIYIILYIYTIM